MSGLFTSIRFVMALLTVLAIAAKPLIPPKTLVLFPGANTKVTLYGPQDPGAAATYRWLDESTTSWRCEYPERFNGISCGIGFTLTEPSPDPEAPQQTLDASDYDGFRLHVDYEGRAQFLRMTLSNRDPAHQAILPGIKEKQMGALVNTDDLRTGPTFIGLEDFSVEEWWTIAENPPRALSGPAFDHLVLAGIDILEPGIHRVRLVRVELVGEHISNESYLLGILLFWSGFLGLEGWLRYSRLKQSAQHQKAQLLSLSGGADRLAKANDELHSRSITDPLTGLLNRYGLYQHLTQITSGVLLPRGTGLLVMDIDHFKTINDRYGHHCGDAILRDFARLITDEIRAGDALARWGGEEFVLLVEAAGPDALMALAEKLRLQVTRHEFPAPLEQPLTVSIGAAWAIEAESFDQLFKRADVALYKAKALRNTAVCGQPD